ncbi:MAG: hypothetical protein J0M04_02680 [Verrucomicrobia bacterium]|nr:hypothetical protein [Verrucomicrobiota bacterium]
MAVRLRLAAWLFFVNCLMAAGMCVLLGIAVVTISFRTACFALVLAVGLGVLGLIQLHFASQVRCPLCLVPPLATRNCSRNRRAGRLFGSYRLRVSCAVIGTGRFRCPYCGEVTRVEPHIR